MMTSLFIQLVRDAEKKLCKIVRETGSNSMELEKLFEPASGLKVKAEISNVYCDKCGKFIRMVQGSFQDEEGAYDKWRCDNCEETKKIRTESLGGKK